MRTKAGGNKHSKPRPCDICADCAGAGTREHAGGEGRHCGVRRDSIRARNGHDADPAYGDTYLDWRPRLRAVED